MPIGQRNPHNEAGTVHHPEQSDGGPGWAVPPSPAQITPALAEQWMRRRLNPVLTDIGQGTDLPMATLPAPGPGLEYRVERLVVNTGATVANRVNVFVLVGQADLASVFDLTGFTTEGIVTNDPNQPLRLGPMDPLYLVWFPESAALTASGLSATVQLRTVQVGP